MLHEVINVLGISSNAYPANKRTLMINDYEVKKRAVHPWVSRGFPPCRGISLYSAAVARSVLETSADRPYLDNGFVATGPDIYF